jgi:hypothetical protein
MKSTDVEAVFGAQPVTIEGAVTFVCHRHHLAAADAEELFFDGADR